MELVSGDTPKTKRPKRAKGHSPIRAPARRSFSEGWELANGQKGGSAMRTTKVLTALFIATLVIASTFTTVPAIFGVDLALAQQSATTDKPILAQNVPKEAVPAALSSATETPEKFRPLLGRWEHNDSQRPARWEIIQIRENGEAKIAYTQGTQPTLVLKATVGEEKNVPVFSFQASAVRWELKYYSTFGGMLVGTLTQSGYAPINVRTYRAK